MTLRTVAVPDPTPGLDWSTVVPGQYLYDITGITATLETGGTPTTVMADSSGNNHNGTFANAPEGAAPIIAGVAATRMGDGVGTRGLVNDGVIDWSGSWAVEGWFRSPFVDQINPINAQIGAVSSPARFFQTFVTVAGELAVAGGPAAGGDAFWSSATGVYAFDNTRHQVGFAYDAGTDTIIAVYDGTNVPMTNMFGNPFNIAGLDHVAVMGDVVGAGTTIPTDGAMVSLYGHALTVGDFASHYVLRDNGGDFIEEVQSDMPGGFWELRDQGGPGGGRQVGLLVTNGNDDIVLIPSGFPDVATDGPFAYSWQPNLQASTQTPNGQVTTIAIPRLLLPAGYTVGTRTLDLAVTDRWSNITVWWSDAAMDSLNPVNPYAYPPGATLVPRYIRSTP